LAVFVCTLLFGSMRTHAAVAYVPIYATNNPPDFSLNFLGIRRFELPSLRELSTITDVQLLDPCGCFFVNDDGSRLFTYEIGVLRVFDGRSHQLLHTWTAPQLGHCNPVFHPHRPNVLILDGTEWFDFESGVFVENAQSLGFLFPNFASGRRVTLSTGRRYLIVSEVTNGFGGGYSLARVIDLLGNAPSRNFLAINGNAVGAFDDRVLVARPTVSSTVNYYDIATGDLLGPVAFPPGTTGISLLPGPRDSIVFVGASNQVTRYTIQTARDAPIEPFLGIPDDPLRRPLFLEKSGSYLLSRFDYANTGCITFIPVPLYAGPMQLSVYDIESNSTTTLHFNSLSSTFGATPVIAGAEQTPQPVPAASPRWLWLLGATIALLGVLMLRSARSRSQPISASDPNSF
jgi:hypothetical protein